MVALVHGWRATGCATSDWLLIEIPIQPVALTDKNGPLCNNVIIVYRHYKQ